MGKTKSVKFLVVLALILSVALAFSNTAVASDAETSQSPLVIRWLKHLLGDDQSITILNPQSYPVIGEEWTIYFTAEGSGTLEIHDHSFPEEVGFVALLYRKIDNEWVEVPVTIEDDLIQADWAYGEGKAVFEVLTPGKHTLAFRFGNLVYAENNAVDASFDRRLSGAKTGQHKVPPIVNIDMEVTVTVTEQIEDTVLIDYIPRGFTVTDANGGTVSYYDAAYDRIEWYIGTLNDTVTRSYTVFTPQRTLPATKYYFYTELVDTGTARSKVWMVIVADPTAVPSQNTGRYNASRPSGLELEGYTNRTNLTGGGCNNTDCHLVSNDFNDDTPPGDREDYNAVPHPGVDRDVAGLFPEWVHLHHGGSNWPKWGTIDGDYNTRGTYNPEANLTQPTMALRYAGYGDAQIGSGDDHSIMRTHMGMWDAAGLAYDVTTSDPPDRALGAQTTANTDKPTQEFYTCIYGAQATGDGAEPAGDSMGCHGVNAANTDVQRNDNIECDDCHGPLNVNSTNNNKHNNTNCYDCHLTSGTQNQLDGAGNVTTRQCYNASCHDTSAVGATDLNTTGAHAGRACRYCHGHGHNITSTNKSDSSKFWNTTCGSQAGSDDPYCHGSGSTKPVLANHNISAGLSPDCAGCHIPSGSTAHNITITACSKCHNATGNGGRSAANMSIPNWINRSTLSTIGANATHGHNATYGGRGNYTNISCQFCHNATSYHSPGLKYGSGGRYDTCNNTDCHDGGSRLAVGVKEINETHSNVSCATCHNNATVFSRSGNDTVGPQNISTNIHASNSSWLIPFNLSATTLYNDSCVLCHDNKTYIDPTLNCSTSSCHGLEIHSANMSVTATVGNDKHSTAGPDCGDSSCHGGTDFNTRKTINFTAVNNSIHARLNYNSSNTTALTQGNITFTCWACHGNGTQPPTDKHSFNDDLSGNRYKYPYRCPDCHNATGSKYNAYAPAPNPSVREHVQDIYADDVVTNGTKKNGTASRGNGTCEYCHNNNVDAFSEDSIMGISVSTNETQANVSHYGANDSLMTPTVNSTNCLYCHNSTVNGSRWGNATFLDFPSHQSADSNDDCALCHITGGQFTINSFHEQDMNEGETGGSNCSNCHDIGGSAKNINFSAVNLSIHKDLNNDSTFILPDGAPNVTKACWACHSNGTNPDDSHNDTLVNGIKLYKNPWKCVDCHENVSAQPYSRYSSGSDGMKPAPLVREHYANASADIHAIPGAANANASCIACHQNSSIWEMLLANSSVNDPDEGTFNVYGASYKGGNISASHYGARRTDITDTSCLYCHQNASTPFPMSPANSSMLNHTNRTDGPSCWNESCHEQAGLHSATLAKPAYNATLCTTSCHTTRENHSSSKPTGGVNCTECHTNASKPGWQGIHGTNGTYLNYTGDGYGANTTAVNCTTCHQNESAVAGMSITPPRIPKPMNHSNNASSGALWNTTNPYWNDSDADKTNDSCRYCHGDTKHNRTGLGNVTIITGNFVNGSINSTSTWCRACHWNDTTTDNLYKGDLFSPRPPEITNDTGQFFNEHPTYYENHSGSGYLGNDSICDNCHLPVTNPSNMSPFMHDVRIGGGGKNCTFCHDIGGASGHNVNISAMNSTNATHRNLNNLTGDPGDDTPLSTSDWNNRRCWACHYNGSAPPEGGHPLNYEDPWTCADCHTNATGGVGADGTGNYSATTVYEHIAESTGDVIPAASCSQCHNNSVIPATDDTYVPSARANVSHYGTNISLFNTTNCTGCHLDTDVGGTWGSATFIDSAEMGSEDYECYECHMDTFAAPDTNIKFHEGNATTWNWDSCERPGCHVIGGDR